jgi:phospholipid/cholesterol/gamma-HCH transport system substrate-binding protein
MEYRVKYTIVGIFVIFLTIAVIIAGYWLSEGRHNKQYRDYIIYTNESVDGMSDQAPVKFNGVTVGYVDSLSINPSNMQQVRLRVRIEKHIPITKATIASTKAQGITGMTFISLRTTDHNSPLLEVAPGEQFPVIASERSLYVQLSDVAGQVTKNLDNIGKKVSKIFSEENIKAFEDSLQNIRKITAVIAKNQAEIEKILKTSSVFFDNAANSSKRFPEITDELSVAIKDLRVMARNFSTTATTARNAVNTLSDQALPELLNVLRRVDTIAEHVDSITRDMKANPAIIVRGKIPTQPGPGE